MVDNCPGASPAFRDTILYMGRTIESIYHGGGHICIFGLVAWARYLYGGKNLSDVHITYSDANYDRKYGVRQSMKSL